MKGATIIPINKKILPLIISIHAPMKGATDYLVYDVEVFAKFQSTHP